MTKPRVPSLRPRGAVVGATVTVAAVVLAACGGQPAADRAAGKTLFTAGCGGCHTLADAGTKGSEAGPVPGPNLDDAFRGARQQGFEESSFRATVRKWIQEAQPPMPRQLVKGQDAENVAAYVASVAGKDQQESIVRPARPFPPEDTPADYDQTRG